MNTSALIMMIGAMSTITLVTAYYFCKVLKTPPKAVDDNRPEINRPDFT